MNCSLDIPFSWRDHSSLQCSFKVFFSPLAVFSETLHPVGYVFPFSFAFHFSALAVCKTPSDSHFTFLHFLFGGMVLVTASCTMLQTSVHSYSVKRRRGADYGSPHELLIAKFMLKLKKVGIPVTIPEKCIH